MTYFNWLNGAAGPLSCLWHKTLIEVWSTRSKRTSGGWWSGDCDSLLDHSGAGFRQPFDGNMLDIIELAMFIQGGWLFWNIETPALLLVLCSNFDLRIFSLLELESLMSHMANDSALPHFFDLVSGQVIIIFELRFSLKWLLIIIGRCALGCANHSFL